MHIPRYFCSAIIFGQVLKITGAPIAHYCGRVQVVLQGRIPKIGLGSIDSLAKRPLWTMKTM